MRYPQQIGTKKPPVPDPTLLCTVPVLSVSAIRRSRIPSDFGRHIPKKKMIRQKKKEKRKILIGAKGMKDASCYISSLPELRITLPSHSLHIPYQFLSKHLTFVGIADDDKVEVSMGGAVEDVGIAFGGVVIVERNAVEVPGSVSVIAG